MSIANPHIHAPQALEKDHKLRLYATYASVSVAVLLIAIKFIAFVMTNSVSLLASLMDSTIDALASIITMYSVRHAIEPADEQHRYGHGKIESLAALAQAMFILSSAIFLLFEAVNRFTHPSDINHTSVGVGVMVISIVLTLGLVMFQTYVVRKTKSAAIDADSLHYKGDLLMNTGVIIALLLSAQFHWQWVDPVFAVLIAFILIGSVIEICRQSFDILLDKEIDKEDRQRIMDIVTAHPKAQHIHDLRTRDSGHVLFIEFHLEMDGNMSLQKAHDVTEDLERKLYDAFPKAEVLIHQEPAGIDDDRLDTRITEHHH